MSNDSSQNDSDSNPKANPQEEKLKNTRRILPTRAVSVYILGVLAVSSSAYGGDLLNAQFIYLGWLLIWIGSIFGTIAVRIWIINHRTKHSMPVWLDSNWSFLITILMCAIACYGAAFLSSHNPIQSQPTASAPAPQPDYIPGTTVTYAVAEHNYPFGYAIIFLNQNKNMTFEVHKTGLMEWKIDVSKVIIEPDIRAGTVKCEATIP